MSNLRKAINPAIIIVGILLLLLPSFTHNDVFKNIVIGNDTLTIFIPLINQATDTGAFGAIPDQSPYLGLSITMWLLGMINRVLHIPPTFLFYYYSVAVMLFAGITLYYFGKMFGGQKAGWLVLVSGMLCNTGLMTLISIGCTVTIINVYIVLLWAIMMALKWYRQRKWYWLGSAVVLLVVFIVIHPTAMYLPFMALVIIGSLFAWSLMTKRRIFAWWHVALGILVAASLLIVGWRSSYIINQVISNTSTGMSYPSYLWQFVRLYFAPVPTIIAVMVFWSWRKHGLKLDKYMKAVLWILGSLSVVLLTVGLLRITLVPQRMTLDASEIMAIGVALVLAKVVERKNTRMLKASAYGLMVVGSLATLKAWVF